MSRLRFNLLACLVGGLMLLGSRMAAAQYFGPDSAYPSARGQYDADPRGGYLERELDDGGYEPRARKRSRRAAPEPSDPDGYVPQYEPRAAEAPRGAGGRRTRVAALPADADPAYSTALDFDDEVDPNETTRALVDDPTGQAPGTLTIDTKARKLYLSLRGGEAIEYGIGVGREGFAWKGVAQIGRKAFWPGWTPPKEMLLRRPDLPTHMEGGMENPLGARALYLFKGNKDTLFRIHGTNEPDTIGKAVSSGCIRMLNADVIDLYGRVSKGARVVVL